MESMSRIEIQCNQQLNVIRYISYLIYYLTSVRLRIIILCINYIIIQSYHPLELSLTISVISKTICRQPGLLST